MEDQFPGMATIETDSVIDMIVSVSNPEEYYDAAEL